jgi:flagellin-specific chaperone FliS
LLEPINESSPDAFIQEQQKKHATKVKRVFAAIGVLCAIAVVISAVVAFSAKNDAQSEATPAELANAYSNSEQEAAREAFKEALTRFEQELAPVLEKLKVAGWKTRELTDLSKQKDNALALFGNAGFVQALGILNTLDADARALIQQWHQAFSEKLEEANRLYQQEQIQAARLALTQADKIKPQHPDSEKLRSQLAAYDSVQQYLNELSVARVENNLENQVALMQSILKADPTRKDMNAPLQEAAAQLNQKRLAFALSQAQQALASNDIPRANTYIQQAEQIEPSAKGITALRSELNKRLSSQGLEALHTRVAALIEADQWQQALSVIEQGLSRYSKDAKLLNSREQTMRILQAQRNFDGFIGRPERLSDMAIRQAAQDTLAQAIVLLPSSASLAKSAQNLAMLIDSYSVKVPVTVESDNNTHISVIGTGIVGKVLSKTIELSPGKYTLEGKREGYRSKRLSIEVKSNTPMTVSLVSDESL